MKIMKTLSIVGNTYEIYDEKARADIEALKKSGTGGGSGSGGSTGGGGVSSWNDLTDKPFYEINETVTATWNYLIDGHEYITAEAVTGSTDPFLVKISDVIVDLDTVSGGYHETMVGGITETSPFEEWGTQSVDVLSAAMTGAGIIYFAPEGTHTVDGLTLTGGIWVQYRAPSSDGEYETIVLEYSSVKQLDEKFIPDTIARKTDMEVDYLLSQSGVPADAKTVGDRFQTVYSQINSKVQSVNGVIPDTDGTVWVAPYAKKGDWEKFVSGMYTSEIIAGTENQTYPKSKAHFNIDPHVLQLGETYRLTYCGRFPNSTSEYGTMYTYQGELKVTPDGEHVYSGNPSRINFDAYENVQYVEFCVEFHHQDGVANAVTVYLNQHALAERTSMATLSENLTLELQAVEYGMIDEKMIPDTIARKSDIVAGGSGIPMPPTAAVGQFIMVTAVDENGRITATQAVDASQVASLLDAEEAEF